MDVRLGANGPLNSLGGLTSSDAISSTCGIRTPKSELFQSCRHVFDRRTEDANHCENCEKGRFDDGGSFDIPHSGHGDSRPSSQLLLGEAVLFAECAQPCS